MVPLLYMEPIISSNVRTVTVIIRLKKDIDSWNKDYLVIADRSADPFCIDLSMEESPVYFGLHGMGQWEFSEAFGNFMDF